MAKQNINRYGRIFLTTEFTKRNAFAQVHLIQIKKKKKKDKTV